MKRRLMLAILICLILAGTTVADEQACTSQKGWINLFNGKDLSAWEQNNGSARYEVKDGMIVGTTSEGSPNSFLCTQKHFSDFELEYEVKVDNRLNSGVQIRSHSKPEYRNGRVHGYQVEIDPSRRSYSGGIYEEATGRGWLQDLSNNEAARRAFRRDQWNRFRVLAVGSSIKTWVNGVPAVDLRDDETASGFIGLQVHSFNGDSPAQVAWRNIRLRDMAVACVASKVLYHVHLTRGQGLEQLKRLSQEMGVKFGVVNNFGRHYWRYNDEHLHQHIDAMQDLPFYVGIQAEGRDWMRVFSPELLAQCDFILADGLTFPNTNGTYTRLWRSEEVHISDVQFFMDRYTDYLVDITSEPIDMIANLTYLPEVIRDEYDSLWTKARMQKIIEACIKNKVAIEINSRYQLPSKRFLKLAKQAGATFAFGGNSHNVEQTKNMDYCIEMAKVLGLTEADMFVPTKQKKISNYR